MGNDDICRRTVLGTLAAGTTFGIAGCAGLTGDSSDDDGAADDESDDATGTPAPQGSPEPAVSGESTDDTDQVDSDSVAVDLTVVGEDDEPLAQEPVSFLTGGDPDPVETVQTDSDGQLSTTIDVGTTSCTVLGATLVDHSITFGFGCQDGGTRLTYTVNPTVTTGTTGSTGDPPTVGPSGDSAATIDVRVLDARVAPVSGEPVLLRDTGGSLDEQRGETGSEGRVRFYEPTGPEPCNPMTVTLTDSEYAADVGCLNDGESGAHTFVLLEP